LTVIPTGEMGSSGADRGVIRPAPHDRADPVVALNRAIAVGEVEGPAAALALVDTLEPELDAYHAFHASRADLVWRLGRSGEAAATFERAADLAPTEAEGEFLRRGGRRRSAT
jgi:RNA polymerase sigma-70 factor, ECF subfamily